MIESDKDHEPSPTSLRTLDGLKVFLGTFPRDARHCDTGRVGMVLAAARFNTTLAQTPAAAGAIFGPAIGALTLGLVGRAAMTGRTGRNEAFNHGGNVAVAAPIGGSAYLFGYGAMFAIVAIMASASIASVLLIRKRDIGHEVARGRDDEKPGQAVGLSQFVGDRRIVIFIASTVLFHFANTAMLPLAGQKATDGMKTGAALLMSAFIIAAQAVMVPVALIWSRLVASWGTQAGLPRRGPDPRHGPIQPHSGALATATGLGAALSNVLAGFVVKAAGFPVGFCTLAAGGGRHSSPSPCPRRSPNRMKIRPVRPDSSHPRSPWGVDES